MKSNFLSRLFGPGLLKLRISVRMKLFLSHVLAVFLVSGGIGSYFYSSAVENLRNGLKERLQASAALISHTIDANEIRNIRTPSDVALPGYRINLEKLRTLRRMNPDIAFLYVMRQEGEKIVFVIDSDESDIQALPGKQYDQALPGLIKGFTGVAVDEKINSDEWGSFLSGYAPIKNSRGEYLVGIDMRADKVQSKERNLKISGLFSLIASVLLSFFFARYLAIRFMAPIHLAIDRCTAISDGKLGERITVHTGDELDQLINAFNDMSGKLSLSEQKKREAFDALNQYKDELEIRIRQRTTDLVEVNDRLSHAIAERINAQNALQEAASTDPLTRMHNRRAMLERLDHEVARHRRNGACFTIAMVDLDHFKRVNDTRGHDSGDSILIETGIRMKSMLRGQDAVARWGGEEFVILLPDTDLQGGRVLAEKIRARIAEAPYYAAGNQLCITASFGLAEFGGNGDIEQLIKSADTALYEAKRMGRNRVEIARSAE